MVVLVAMIVSSFVLSTLSTDVRAEQSPVQIHCAMSMKDAIDEAAAAYSARSGTPVRVQSGASSTLAKQIVMGARTDVFVSAHRDWMEALERDGLILPKSVREIASNRLVLAGMRDRSLEWDPTVSLVSRLSGRLALGHPEHVPLGMYSRDALTKLGRWSEIGSHVLTTHNSASAVAALVNGHANGAIIYQTDLHRSPDLVAVHHFLHPVPRVWAGLDPERRGAAFLDFLTSSEGQQILRSHGFSVEGSTSEALRSTVVEDNAVGQIVSLSLRVALVSVLMILPFGLFFGWLLARRDFPGKALLNALLHVPLVLPPVVTGYLLLWCFGKNGPLESFGFAFSWGGAALASAVVAFPLFVRAVRLGFEAVDPKLEEAAMSLGSPPLGVFVKISLPLCAGAIISGMLLAFGRSLGEFGATITFAGSIVGETETLPLAIHAALQSPTGGETVATLSVISALLAFATLLVGEWFARRARWH